MSRSDTTKRIRSPNLERKLVSIKGGATDDHRAVGERPSLVIGRLAGWREKTGPLVDWPGNTGGPRAARTTLAMDAPRAKRWAKRGQEVLLAFAGEGGCEPVIMGLLQPKPAEVPPAASDTSTPAASDATTPAASEASTPATPLAVPGTVNVQVDGRRIELVGQDEVVLKCGEASITLRRNGRIVLRGAYVESRAKGVNRIKGGTVQIN